MKEKENKNAAEAQAAKEKGNECFKKQDYAEAILHYSEGIKLDPTNYSLFSNRSSAFLHLQQYYLALQDARETISLQPRWAKGYFRKGEVEFATFNFLEALLSYQTALVLQPGDPTVEQAIEKTKLRMRTEKRAEEQIPWLGAGIGIILGVTIVITDHLATQKPSLTHPVAMVLVTILIALFGYGGCRAYRQYVKNQRASMLDPPVDLLDQNQEAEEEDEAEKVRPKYTKAQARQRFKKGRS